MHVVNNIIAQGTTVRGEVTLTGNLRIEGFFEGVIYTRGRVYISHTGRVISDIHSDDVVAGGTVRGNIYARGSVRLLKTGNVRGNIYAKNISAEEGVIFQGDCVMLK